MRHLTCNEDIEVIGVSMLSIAQNINAQDIEPFLEKHGLVDIKADEWYPAHLWLDVMNDLAKHANLMQNLVAIGMSLAEKVKLPPQLENASLPQILQSWNKIYQGQHRGGELPAHVVEKISDTEYRCTFRDIYPDDFKYGLGYGFAKRFLPKGTRFTVSYDDMKNRMDFGDADKTVMTIKWE